MNCENCVYYKKNDKKNKINNICYHDFLYNTEGDIIEEHKTLIQEYMKKGNCPLKEIKK